jgi:ribosome biogenesis GTPase
MTGRPNDKRRNPRRTRAGAKPAAAAATRGDATPDTAGARIAGTVIRVDSGASLVDTENGVLRCTLRGRLSRSRRSAVRLIAVGDRVEVEPGAEGHGVIEAVATRRTKLSRRAAGPRQHEQVVAANVDQILVVGAFSEPPLNLDLIDRYLVAAGHGGMRAIICINKLDLLAPDAHGTELTIYEQLGYAVVKTCALSGVGVDALRDRLLDHTTVIAGPSGVGKSTLINAVQPGLELRTAPVSAKSGEGRHTTTASQLLRLDGGGYVIDTPGIREYTLWEIEPRELDEFFPDIDAFREGCRFSDCTHSHEPGCEVKQAVERGEVTERRYASYLHILDEVHEEARVRDDAHEARARAERLAASSTRPGPRDGRTRLPDGRPPRRS